MELAIPILGIIGLIVAFLFLRVDNLAVRVATLEEGLRRLASGQHIGRGKALRMEVSVPAAITVDGKKAQGTVVDLSTSGAQLKTSHTLAVQQAFALQITGRSGKTAETQAMVMRLVDPETYGVRFVDPGPGFRKLVARLHKDAVGSAVRGKKKRSR